jgi:pyruvate formate lyase activating enzyme
VTFSGGEPLAQMNYLLETLPLLKAEGIHVAIDTSGFTDYEKLKELLPYVDLFLLDIKAFSDADYKKVTERPMGPLEKFMETLIEENYQGRIWIRHVMVEGWSDSEDAMDRLWATVEKLVPRIDQIDILPYHTMGVDKYEALGRTYALEGVPPMDKDRAGELEVYVNKKLEEVRASE